MWVYIPLVQQFPERLPVVLPLPLEVLLPLRSQQRQPRVNLLLRAVPLLLLRSPALKFSPISHHRIGWDLAALDMTVVVNNCI